MRADTTSDELLIAKILEGDPGEADRCREELFRRYYPKVLSWCRRFSGDAQEALDLAQEVFLRVHERIRSFEGRSRFSTWLYTVTRRTVINRGIAAKRKAMVSLEGAELPDPIDPGRGADEAIEVGQLARELRRAMARDLDPLEAQVLYLHHVNGMTLPAITRALNLENKSGAKAYIVNGRRKLNRRFGRWLRRQTQTNTI